MSSATTPDWNTVGVSPKPSASVWLGLAVVTIGNLLVAEWCCMIHGICIVFSSSWWHLFRFYIFLLLVQFFILQDTANQQSHTSETGRRPKLDVVLCWPKLGIPKLVPSYHKNGPKSAVPLNMDMSYLWPQKWYFNQIGNEFHPQRKGSPDVTRKAMECGLFDISGISVYHKWYKRYKVFIWWLVNRLLGIRWYKSKLIQQISSIHGTSWDSKASKESWRVSNQDVDLSMAIPGSDWLEVPTIYVWPKNKA